MCEDMGQLVPSISYAGQLPETRGVPRQPSTDTDPVASFVLDEEFVILSHS
jgi:hypothetical protein